MRLDGCPVHPSPDGPSFGCRPSSPSRSPLFYNRPDWEDSLIVDVLPSSFPVDCRYVVTFPARVLPPHPPSRSAVGFAQLTQVDRSRYRSFVPLLVRSFVRRSFVRSMRRSCIPCRALATYKPFRYSFGLPSPAPARARAYSPVEFDHLQPLPCPVYCSTFCSLPSSSSFVDRAAAPPPRFAVPSRSSFLRCSYLPPPPSVPSFLRSTPFCCRCRSLCKFHATAGATYHLPS